MTALKDRGLRLDSEGLGLSVLGRAFLDTVASREASRDGIQLVYHFSIFKEVGRIYLMIKLLILMYEDSVHGSVPTQR